MAQLHKIRLLENERIDKPDHDKIQEFVEDDLKSYNRYFFTDEDKWISRGVVLSVVSGLNISVAVSEAVLFNTEASGENEFFLGENGHAALTATVTNNATNYVHIEVVSGNTGTNATRVFWDPSLNDGEGGEFLQAVDTEEFLDVQLYITTSGFSSDPDKIPVGTVVASAGSISSIIDNRNLYFRLGKGEPLNTGYSFTLSSPSEPATSSFTGGDKDIKSMKDWMDLTMTRIKELSGETYWYTNTSGFNNKNIFDDLANTVITGGGTASYSGANVFAFTADITLRVISTGVTYTIPFASQSGQTIGSDQVAYINLDAQLSGPATGQRGTSGNRALIVANRNAVPLDQDIYWIAYRDGTQLHVRGARQKLNQGAEIQLGSGITQDLLTFIGSTSETDNSPNYTSTNLIADGDSLVAALSKIDAGAVFRAVDEVITGLWTFQGSNVSTVVTATTPNDAGIVLQNTNGTANNYQSLDFKNDTGAVVGRIAYQNVTHTAGAEDSRVYITTMTAGVMSAPIGINSSGVHLNTNGKLNFNGSFTSGVYATSISSSTLDFYTNSVLSLRVTPTYVQMGPGCDAILDSTKKLFFDGGGDTYIYESSANNLRISSAGTDVLSIIGNASPANCSVSIPATTRLYLDGGGDTSIEEISSNVMLFKTGGSLGLQVDSSQNVTIGGGKLYFNAVTNDIYFDASLGTSLFLRVNNTVAYNFKDNQLQVAGTLCTSLGTSEAWLLGGFTGAGDAASNGYVAVTIDGVAYKLSTRA